MYRAWKLGHDATLPPLPFINAIEIDPVPDVDPRRISYLVETKANQVLDTKTLGSDLKRIYAMGIFEIVSYEIVQDGDRNILHITPTPKSWGPTYLKLGLFLGTDFTLGTQFNVVALVDATRAQQPRGPVEDPGEGRQPHRGRDAVLPAGHLSRQLLRLAVRRLAAGSLSRLQRRGDALATYQVSRGVVGMDLGYDFGTWGELRVGYLRAFGKARRQVGDPLFPEIDWDEGGLNARHGGRPDRQRQPSARRIPRGHRLPGQSHEPRGLRFLRPLHHGHRRRADDRSLDRTLEGGGGLRPRGGDPVLRHVSARGTLPSLGTASRGNPRTTSTCSPRRCSTTGCPRPAARS